MGKEIERKFLVCGDEWRSGEATEYRQGYLCTDRDRTVRVRVAGGEARLTIKGRTQGATRPEYEYDIPLEDARQLLDHLCMRPLIEKRRYRVRFGNHLWEVDEFSGENEGLILAEVELESEGQSFEKPPWIADEVTDDPRYFNANLVQKPYAQW